MKKSICLILCIVLLATSFSFANTNDMYVDENVDVLNYNAPSLYSESDDSLAKEAEINKVTYCYEFEEIDGTNANVRMDFDIKVGNETYPASASGIVTSFELSSGEFLWEGPLDGTATINEKEYDIIIGFSKLSNSQDVRAGVTIKTSDGNYPLGISAFSFGGNVITKNVLDEIEEYSVASTEMISEAEGISTYAANNFALKDISLGGADAGMTIPGYGQRATLYFDRDTNRVSVGAKSYCADIQKYYSSKGYASTTIASHSIKLKRNSDANSSKTHISGIETFDFSAGNFSGAIVSLKPLFEDIMSLLGVPSSTITTVVGSLRGSVTSDEHTNETTVSFTYGMAQTANFDKSNVGTPIVFQLAQTNSHNGQCSYTYFTNMRYRTLVTPTGSSLTTSYYNDAETVSKSVALTLT